MAINFSKLQEIAHGLLNKRTSRTFHVAFLIKKGRCHTISHNENKSHPKIKQFPYGEKCGLHAELSCFIRGGLENYKGFQMCVCRIDRNNCFNMSKPCFACAAAAKMFGIKDLYYTNAEGDWKYMDVQHEKVIDRRYRFYNHN